MPGQPDFQFLSGRQNRALPAEDFALEDGRSITTIYILVG